MASGVFGGGVIFVVAALLWAAVLVPSWIRRREFKTAEQNALRLQRTLRVLAETAEVPTEVRVEATAREALAQERLLRTAQRQQEAERKAQLSRARAAQLRAEMQAQQMNRKQAALVRAAKLQRGWVRNVRKAVAIVCVVAIIAAFVGVGLAVAGLGATVLVSALAATFAGLGALVLIAPGRVKFTPIDAEHVIEEVPTQQAGFVREHDSDGRAAAAHAAAQAAAAARIERARAMARARAERPAVSTNQPGSMLLIAEVSARAEARPAAADTSSPAGRVRQMGVVGDTTDGMLDLDEVLRARRRA